MKLPTHRQYNHALTLLVVCMALYVVCLPMLPQIKWLLNNNTDSTPYGGKLAEVLSSQNNQTPTPPSNPALTVTPRGNRLVVPSAAIDVDIYDGDDVNRINNGGSLRKSMSPVSPAVLGNTVIIGHRFTYGSPGGGFYHLDKVRIGDYLALYWDGQELLYKVSEIKVVSPTSVEIEDSTSDRVLTLYTCTPMYTFENRLVVIAKPVEVL